MAEYRLTTPQVAKLADVPFRTLDHWVRTGLITCQHAGEGHGSRRKWTLPDIVRARTVAELRRHGLHLGKIREIVSHLQGRWHIDDPLSYNHSRIVLVNEEVLWAGDTGELMNVLDGQLVVKDLVQIPVGALVEDTRERVRQIAAEAARG